MKSCCDLLPNVASCAYMPCPMRKSRFSCVFIELPNVPYDFLELQWLIGCAQIQKGNKSLANCSFPYLYFCLFFHTGNNPKNH